jgi:fructose-bisphosphate aldolase class I
MNNAQELIKVARALVAPGKGILAADESTGTIEKRFAAIGVPSTEENRRSYREMLFTTPDIGAYISGVIMFDETIRQSAGNGKRFVEVLQGTGILPGIKVDKGLKPFGGSMEEKLTEGLDGLQERLAEYKQLGAKFTKWRSVIAIGEAIPTDACIKANMHDLARYAALAQEAGLVPIVEPEVLMDGDHGIGRCGEVTEHALKNLFDELRDQNVLLEGTVLKTNMVVPGKKATVQATPAQIAEASLRVYRRTVPATLPGIAFLSGGQSEIEATVNLNEMNKTGPQPWELSFSYGRALQESALKAWAGKPENAPEAQKAFYRRAKCNSTARYGKYAAAMEKG